MPASISPQKLRFMLGPGSRDILLTEASLVDGSGLNLLAGKLSSKERLRLSGSVIPVSTTVFCERVNYQTS